jgi:hypothetical protein
MSAAVAAGDFIGVGLTFADNATNGVITDGLGNTYTRKGQVHETERGLFLEIWECIVTNAGTPTITAQFDPTPGTTSPAGYISLVASSFSGSDSGSTVDGAGAGQMLASPVSTSTDAVTTGTFATSVDGVLLYSVATSGVVGGTGFTQENGASGGDIQLSDEWAVQTSHSASTEATWTATGTSAKAALVIAITPAGTGGGGAAPSYYYLLSQGLI